MSPERDLHPNDRALLYDLLDERLAPRAADEVRRRLADEPALRAAYEQLSRLRACLVALPSRPLPTDFLERVRARAGFPAAPADVASASKAEAASAAERVAGAPAEVPATAAPPAASAAGPASSEAPARVARVLTFARYAYAAAAVLVVALGVAWWRLTPGARETMTQTAGEAGERSSTWEAKRAPLDRAAPPPASASGPTAGRNVAPGGTSDDAKPRFGGPLGAVPSGLRTPSDDPTAAPAPAAAPVAATSPTPPSTASEESDADRAARISGGGGGGDAAAKTGTPTSEPAEKRPDVPALPAAAAEDADDVLVIYADSYDVARAEVALLVAQARAGLASVRAPESTTARVGAKALGAVRDGATAAGKDAGAAGRATPPELANDKLARGDRADASGVPQSMGSFVVELDGPALQRLSRALTQAQPTPTPAEHATTPVEPPGEPVPVDSAPAVSPPARPAPVPASGSVSLPLRPTASPPPSSPAAPPPPPAPVPATPSTRPSEAAEPADLARRGADSTRKVGGDEAKKTAESQETAGADAGPSREAGTEGERTGGATDSEAPSGGPAGLRRVRIVVLPRR